MVRHLIVWFRLSMGAPRKRWSCVVSRVLILIGRGVRSMIVGPSCDLLHVGNLNTHPFIGSSMEPSKIPCLAQGMSEFILRNFSLKLPSSTFKTTWSGMGTEVNV